MDASTDSTAGLEPGRKTLGGGGATSTHQGKAGSVQTCNGNQTMNSIGSAASSVAAVSTAAPVSKGLPAAAIMPPASTTVIQTPLVNSQSVVSMAQAVNQAAGATVTLVRPPIQTSTTFNGNNNLMVASAAGQPGVNNVQLPAPGSAGVRPHIIKAEPPTMIMQTTTQPAATSTTVSAPRAPATLAAGLGGIRTLAPQMMAPQMLGPQMLAPQMLAPRLPQTPTGLPPGMVIIRSESGHLLMIPQQALVQMQAQSQGGIMPQATAPTNMHPSQAPGNISRQVAPSTIIRQGCPTPTTLTATTTLHRPPILQSSVGAAVPGMTPRTDSQTEGTTVTSVTVSKETMENVKKCKNFLSTLIKLASTGKQSTETAAIVRELVKQLLEGKLEAEEFTSKLYKELNSSPQPYLVPFLKRSLPAVRQFTPDSAAFIQQSQPPQPASGPVSSTSSNPPKVVLSSPTPRLTSPIIRQQLQPVASKQGQNTSLVVQLQQQRATLRPQVTLPTTPMVTLRNQAPGRIMLGQQQVQLKELQPTALTAAHKNKTKEAGGTFKDEDDINDVASMAGVNLSEESANILASNSGLVGAVTRSCKDEAFVSCALLQKRMLEIGSRFGVGNLGAEVVNFVSHATQQRLQNLIEKVSQVAQHRNVNLKEDDTHEYASDVRAQLKFFEQLDLLEKQRKEEQEREILLKAAKSRARQEDPEQLRLKQKAKEMQQQELAQMRQREANLTALAAIGPRKKRKVLDSNSSAAAAEGSGAGPSLSAGAGMSSSRPTRQRITRVNLRDLLFCLENERFSSHSHFLYKGFLK